MLADNIVVIDHGRAIARGTADELKSQTGGERIEVVLADAAHRDEAVRILASVAHREVQIADNGRALTAAVQGGGAGRLITVLQRLEQGSIGVLEVGLRRPTLDDVFLQLTGHASEDDQSEQTQEVAS